MTMKPHLWPKRPIDKAAPMEPDQQSRQLAELAADPTSDEADVMRWINEVSDTDGWKAQGPLSSRPAPST